MKKRIIPLMLLGLIVFTITACGGNQDVVTVTVVPTLETAVANSDAEVTPEVKTTVPEQPTQIPVASPTTETIEPTQEVVPVNDGDTVTFQLEAWADNWFAAYVGEELIIEDSVSITTERSFNAETATFEASYPLTLNFILKDFKENDTGLEYIGSQRQQMGDGGFIMQLTDMSLGDVVAVSNAEWACTVIHEAPLDKSCENESNPVAGTAPCEFSDLGEPDGWKAVDFDDSSWTATTIHSATDVSPKDGYDQISWDADAALIWGPDLETDNTILCRVTVVAP